MVINYDSAEYSSNDILAMASQLPFNERWDVWEDHDEFDPDPEAYEVFDALDGNSTEYEEGLGVDALAEESDFGLDIDSAGLQNPTS